MAGTLAEARRDLSAAIAALRALGCKVSTVVGHDLAAGEAHYRITPPDGVDIAVAGQSLTIYGVGSLRMLGTGDAVRVVTERAIRWAGLGADDTWRRDIVLRLKEAAVLMRRLAGRIRSFDRSGSASRQHYIDTGVYLRVAVSKVEEIRALPNLSRVRVPADDFPADFIKTGPDDWMPDVDSWVLFGSEELAYYGIVVTEVGP